MKSLAHFSDSSFKQDVLESELPVLVDFWAEWCAPCRTIAPIVKDLAAQYGDKVKVVKMNVDENQSTPAKYGVRSIPLVLVIKDGQVVDQILGARPKAAFEEMLKKVATA